MTPNLKSTEKRYFSTTVSNLGQMKLAPSSPSISSASDLTNPEKLEQKPAETRSIVLRLINYLKEH